MAERCVQGNIVAKPFKGVAPLRTRVPLHPSIAKLSLRKAEIFRRSKLLHQMRSTQFTTPEADTATVSALAEEEMAGKTEQGSFSNALSEVSPCDTGFFARSNASEMSTCVDAFLFAIDISLIERKSKTCLYEVTKKIGDARARRQCALLLLHASPRRGHTGSSAH